MVEANGIFAFSMQREKQFLQAESVHFDIGQDHRLSRAIDHLNGLIESFRERGGVARFVDAGRRMVLDSEARHHIARNFDVDWALVPQSGMQNAIDLLKRRLRITEHC